MRNYQFYFIKLGKLYYVKKIYSRVKNKKICNYEFTSHKSVAFPFDEERFAQEIAYECGGETIVQDATFDDYVNQGQRWEMYIENKIYTKAQRNNLILFTKNQKRT